MRKMRRFKCENGALIERLVFDGVDVAECKCGGKAIKTISAARYLGNTVGKSPSL